MPKDEWGVKRVCPKCSVRFYDLQKDPMTCPSCGASFDIASLSVTKPRSVAPDRASKQVAAVDDDLEDGDILVEDDDSVDDLDDELLDEDDDDNVSLDEIADVAGGDDEG
jgi:uncharacterized protein (TIGR02300 family)